MEDTLQLTGMAFVIVAATLCGMAMTRLKQPAIVGYILAGVLLGPSGLGFVSDREQVGALAEMERTLQSKAEAIGKEKTESTGLKAEIVSLQNRCAELDGRRAERELANQELQDRLTERAAEIEALRHDLSAAEQASAPLQGRLEELQSKLDAARAESERLQTDLDALRVESEQNTQAARDQADGEIASLQTTLDTALEDKKNLQSRFADAESQVTSLREELAQEQEQLQEARLAAKAADAKLAGTVQERDRLQAEFDGVSALLEEVETEFRE